MKIENEKEYKFVEMNFTFSYNISFKKIFFL